MAISPCNKYKGIALCLFMALSIQLKAQDEKGWLKHVELGIERSFFTEIGAYDMYWKTSSKTGLLVNTGATFVISDKPFLAAPKAGLSFFFNELLFVRTDISLYSDLKNTQPVFTPKLGVNILGLYIFYGRNINMSGQEPFSALGRNQLGIGLSSIPKMHLKLF